MIQNPLVVDLDGTLIQTDMLHETALKVLRDCPFALVRFPEFLFKGKAALKQYIASISNFDPALLPYNNNLIEWLNVQRSEGRRLILCTASDRKIALKVANHVGIFDEVIASDGVQNIAGKRKAEILIERFGKKGFDYVGNGRPDLHVWRHARKAVVIGGSTMLARAAGEICQVEMILPSRDTPIFVWGQVIRIHQWLKNLLLFVPLLAAHDLGNGNALLLVAMAFVAFCLCASSVYIANDLFDLESDRMHPRKRNRPFASGQVPIWKGILLGSFLLAVSFSIAGIVGGSFLLWQFFYFSLTCAYSWFLKRLMIVDCITLALLYTLRIIAGASAAGQSLSFWLLAFSVFIFLSLAFVKRYAEFEIQGQSMSGKIHGRGYQTSDAPLIQTMGIVAGYTSVLVLALYLNSEAVAKLYRAPEFIWGAVPVMLFWISWMWMQAHRGNMHDDPLVFAVKDRASLATGVALTVVLTVGAVGLS